MSGTALGESIESDEFCNQDDLALRHTCCVSEIMISRGASSMCISVDSAHSALTSHLEFRMSLRQPLVVLIGALLWRAQDTRALRPRRSTHSRMDLGGEAASTRKATRLEKWPTHQPTLKGIFSRASQQQETEASGQDSSATTTQECCMPLATEAAATAKEEGAQYSAVPGTAAKVAAEEDSTEEGCSPAAEEVAAEADTRQTATAGTAGQGVPGIAPAAVEAALVEAASVEVAPVEVAAANAEKDGGDVGTQRSEDDAFLECLSDALPSSPDERDGLLDAGSGPDQGLPELFEPWPDAVEKKQLFSDCKDSNGYSYSVPRVLTL